MDTLRRQMDNLYAQKKVENGRTLLPQMYGDPRGYGHTGQESWYHWTSNLFIDRLTEIYLWSMDRKDLERVPKDGLDRISRRGRIPIIPRRLCARISSISVPKTAAMRDDPTTADTRLADWPMGLNPATTQTLVNLMLGGYLAGNIWTLHSRRPLLRSGSAPFRAARRCSARW